MLKIQYGLSGSKVLKSKTDWVSIACLALGAIGLFCLVIAISTNAIYGGPHLIR